MKQLQLRPVKSSAIAAIGHDADTSTLHVEFTSGATYEYPDVSADEYAALHGAPSIGSHFGKRFGKQQGRKIS